MIDLYGYTTPNCWKASIMLEETGLPYTPHLIHLRKGDQKTPEYTARVPAGKVPSMVDRDADDLPVYGSSPILIYLAEKTGMFWPKDGRARIETFDWFMFNTTDFGFGFINWTHYLRLPEKNEFAINDTRIFVERMCEIADKRLRDREYFVGDYSIADIAAIPFICRARRDEELLAPYPNLTRWADAIEAREAVQRGLAVPVVP